MATLGVVTVGTPHLLVTRFYERGSLKASLERNEHSHTELRAFCQGVASGAAHLASCNFVHRDLATRNVLLDIQMVPKISDFGLSRNLAASLYYKPALGRSSVAIRWCSPEVLSEQKFSEASDGGRDMVLTTAFLSLSPPPPPPSLPPSRCRRRQSCGGDPACPVLSMRLSERCVIDPVYAGAFFLSLRSRTYPSSPCPAAPHPPRALPPPICRTSCSLGVRHRGL